MKRNVSVVRFKFRCNILIGFGIIKQLPGLVGIGTPCRWHKTAVSPLVLSRSAVSHWCVLRVYADTWHGVTRETVWHLQGRLSEYGLPRRDALQFRKQAPTFRKNLLPRAGSYITHLRSRIIHYTLSEPDHTLHHTLHNYGAGSYITHCRSRIIHYTLTESDLPKSWYQLKDI
jgi:hypothetical protein